MAAWRWRPAPYGGHRDLSDRLIFLRQTTRMVREHIRAARLEVQGPAVGQGGCPAGPYVPQHPRWRLVLHPHFQQLRRLDQLANGLADRTRLSYLTTSGGSMVTLIIIMFFNLQVPPCHQLAYFATVLWSMPRSFAIRYALDPDLIRAAI